MRVEERSVAADLLRIGSQHGARDFNIALKRLGIPLGNGVTVAQQTLTLFVLVRIQVPQPTLSL